MEEICAMCATIVTPGKRHERNFFTRGECVEIPDDRDDQIARMCGSLIRDVSAASVQP